MIRKRSLSRTLFMKRKTSIFVDGLVNLVWMMLPKQINFQFNRYKLKCIINFAKQVDRHMYANSLTKLYSVKMNLKTIHDLLLSFLI